MTCKKCGKSIKPDASVCPHCGAITAEQVSLGSISAAQQKETPQVKKKKSDPNRGLRITLIVVSILAVLAILGAILSKFWPDLVVLFGKGFVEKSAHIDDKFTVEEQEEMDVNTELPTAKEGILNIALLGLDERGETDAVVDGAGKGKSFHSDAIIILTIDRRDANNPRIKMSSIARDTLVYVEGYNSKNSMTKLTHAFDYGYRKAKSADKADGKQDHTEADYKREGAKTAIKTINYNFHMNITEYVYVNFVEFMDIIDYVGGVTINVQQKELNELNKHVRAMRKECDRDIDTVAKAGEQNLSGGQALAYARIRKIDSDIKRGNRQRDVLTALFNKVKKTSLTKIPEVVTKILGMCHTTLSAEEIVEMGTWAISKDPKIVNYALPDTKVHGYSWIWEGNHPNYAWVWIYDLDYASALLIDFIFDKNTAADLPKPTMPNEPKVTQATTTTPTGGNNTTVVNPSDTEFTDPTGTDIIDPSDTEFTDPTGTDIIDPSNTEFTDPTGTDITDPDVSDPTGGEFPDPTDPAVPTDPTEPDPTEPIVTTPSTNPGLVVGGTTDPTRPGMM